MSDPFANVSPGQAVVNSARFHNAVAAVVREFIRNGGYVPSIGGMPGVGQEPTCVRVPVRNTTNHPFDPYQAIEITDATIQPPRSGDGSSGFDSEWYGPVMEGIDPTSADCDFAITQRPMMPDEVAECAILGVTWADVYYHPLDPVSNAHNYVKPSPDVFFHLVPNATGPAKILWKPTLLWGNQYSLLLLLGCECGCECATLTGTSTPAALAANQNDYAPNTGLAALLRLQTNGSGVKNITGIAGGVSGYRMLVKNVGAQSINLTEDDAASSAANRLKHTAGLSYSLVAGASIEYVYDGDASRWVQT